MRSLLGTRRRRFLDLVDFPGVTPLPSLSSEEGSDESAGLLSIVGPFSSYSETFCQLADERDIKLCFVRVDSQ